MRPKVFIGSSVESISVAYAAQQNLERAAEVTVWTQGVFGLSRNSLESLLSFLKTVDFGIFIFHPDDEITIRNVTSKAVRDNVLFELGLFSGHLSPERCFIIRPRGREDFHLPTDISALTVADYDADRSDKNLRAALGPVCNNIIEVLQSFQESERETWLGMSDPGPRLFPHLVNSQRLAGYWLSRFSYSAKRSRRTVLGFQFDIERLETIGPRALRGANVLCSSSDGKHYQHELKAQIFSNYLLGSWFNTNTNNLGAFQLHIHTHPCVMSGVHIGNDNDNAIPHGDWTWIKLDVAADKILHGRSLKPAAELGEGFPSWLKAAKKLDLTEILTS